MNQSDESVEIAPDRRRVLEVENLNIDFWVDGTWYPAVIDVDFTLHGGEVLAIVGESGSGKSTTGMALLGLLPTNANVRGSIMLGKRNLVGLDERSFRQIRGRHVSVIFQEPMTALNPVYTIGFQIAEMLRSHQSMSPKTARTRALELLKLVEIPDPERRIDSYPHQLSGGQRQRAMIAQALACDPEILIADEPTTALDVTVQAEILKLLRDLRDRIDAGILLITHDMGVVADLSDNVMVMKRGEIVERGDARDVFYSPRHPYTQELLAAVPHLGSVDESAVEGNGEVAAEAVDARATEDGGPATVEHTVADDLQDADGVIGQTTTAASSVVASERTGVSSAESMAVVQLDDVVIEYPRRGRVPAFRAVDGVTFDIQPSEVVGLVGESGSGKTTIGRALVGLLKFKEGSAHVLGTNMVGLSRQELRAVRRNVSFVFQDPGSSLNPRMPVGESIGEPLKLHNIARGAALDRKVEELLDQVQLARSLRNRYPHELSGGQRQRIGIARSLALGPKLLIADEPTSALDVSVQAKVLDLFQELQSDIGFACLFISHDLAVVEHLAQRVAVMKDGKLVEFGRREEILRSPEDPYTKRLLAAVPVPDPDEQRQRREERDRLLEAEAALEAGAVS